MHSYEEFGIPTLAQEKPLHSLAEACRKVNKPLKAGCLFLSRSNVTYSTGFGTQVCVKDTGHNA